MIINRNSWHYRFLEFMAFRPKPSLCPYVRQLVVSMLMMAMLSFFAFWIINAMLSAMAWVVAGLIHGFVGAETLAVAGIPLWCIGAGYVGCIWLDKLYDRRRTRKDELRHAEGYVVKEPNLFWSYIKAIHNKVCPSIDFIR
jgi:hypothetical protein